MQSFYFLCFLILFLGSHHEIQTENQRALTMCTKLSVLPLQVLLVFWAHAMAVGRHDLAIVLGLPLFRGINCAGASDGAASKGGWRCLFAPMPHLCTFDDEMVRNKMTEDNLPASPTYIFGVLNLVNLATPQSFTAVISEPVLGSTETDIQV